MCKSRKGLEGYNTNLLTTQLQITKTFAKQGKYIKASMSS